jgi:release factor glutamine methyltransferase
MAQEMMRQPGMTVMNVRGALREAMARLESAGVPSHALAAELLLMCALGRDRAWIYSHAEDEMATGILERINALVAERASGVPTQYLTGKQEFFGLEFEVTAAVLIPRPETEHVVEVALERLGVERRNAPLCVADVGTGSGCIAAALARELARAEIVATDVSSDALEVARRNAVRHGVAGRIRFVESDLFAAFRDGEDISTTQREHWRERDSDEKNAGWQPFAAQDKPALRFDAIVCNPPYIPIGEAPLLQREVRGHEPAVALFAGEDGMAIYEPLVREAREFLAPGGLIVLELGHNSLAGVTQIFERSSGWSDVRVDNDLAGIPRVISAVASRR